MQNGQYEGAVNAGCLLWLPTLDTQEYRDVMASLLYMQLAATKKHSPFQRPHEWHQVFSGGLLQFGWAPLTQGYREQTAKGDFTLAQLAAAEWDMPCNPAQQAAWDGLYAQLAGRTGDDAVLKLLQGNIASALSTDAVDASPGTAPNETDSIPPGDLHVETESAPLPRRKPVPAPPRTAITVQLGQILPDRRMQLLFLHFATRAAASENVLSQVFAAKEVVGKVLVKSFFAELSEQQYGQVRDRFSSLLQPHWDKQVAEHLPLGGQS